MGLRLPGPDADDTELLVFKDTWFNYENPVRNRILEKAARNLLYYVGEQWVALDTGLIGASGNGYSFRRIPPQQDLPQPVTNFIADAVEAELGSFASRKLVPVVLPRSNEPDIKAAARAGESILQYKLDRLSWGALRNDFDLHRCIFPLALMWLRWDESFTDLTYTANPEAVKCVACNTKLSSLVVSPQLMGEKASEIQHLDMAKMDGETLNLSACPTCEAPTPMAPYEVGPDEAALPDYLGRPLGKTQPKGEPIIEVPTRFDYFPENSGVGIHPRTAKAHGIAMVRTVEWAEEHYPELGEIDSEDPHELLRWHPAVNSWDIVGNLLQSGAEVYADHTRVYTLITQPCKAYPNGEVLEWVGQRFAKRYPLMREVNGQKAATHVVALARHKLVPGRLDGKSLVDDGISPQNRINTIDSQFIETRLKMGKPNILSPSGITMDQPEWAGPNRDILRYDPSPLAPNATPQTFGGTLFPIEAYQEREQCVNDLRTIIGPKGVETGEPPRNVSTTSGLQLLGEQIDKRRAPREEERLIAFTAIWEGLLTQLSVFRTELDADTYEMLEEDTGIWTAQQFSGATLKGQTKVKIDAQAEVSKSLIQRESVREAQADGLLDISTPMARKRILELRGLPTNINEDINHQVDDADRDWVAFRDKQAVPVIDYGVDDPVIHYSVLVARLLGEQGLQMADAAGWSKVLPNIAGWEEELQKLEMADQLARQFYPDTSKEAADQMYAQLAQSYVMQKKAYEDALGAATLASQGQPVDPASLPPPPQQPPPPLFAPRDMALRIVMVWQKMLQEAEGWGKTTIPEGHMDQEGAEQVQQSFLGLMAVIYTYRRLGQAMAAAAAPPAPGQPAPAQPAGAAQPPQGAPA